MKKFNILEKINSGLLSHAIIISGDDFVSKDDVIFKISSFFACKSLNKPCGNCSFCQKTKEGINPDIFILDNADKQIVVDDIRKIRKDAYIPPNECDNKIYIIKNAQKMNINAQNALLKILEEPPAFVRFILEVTNEQQLLDTILSRCVCYKINLENQVFDDETVKIAEMMMKYIDNEIKFFEFNYKKLLKPQFVEIMTVCKIILKDGILLGFDENYEPFSDVSKEIFLNKSFKDILKIYDICCDIIEKCEYNISVLNLAFYFITEIKERGKNFGDSNRC